MNFKLIGCVLLIIGTCIGAGMLALPLATAALGFPGSLVMLVICWFMMLCGAFLILEVNLWFKQHSHLISMAKATLGPFGQIVTWLSYLLLLYSLLAAYIAGGSDLLHYLLKLAGFSLVSSSSAILFTALFGAIVILGIRSVDIANRGFMVIKLLAYCSVIILLMPFVSVDYLVQGDIKQITSLSAIMVTITSFGFATLVPSLRVYFANDIRQLKKAIFWGSSIPLFCYIAWDLVIMGLIPIHGESGLISILQSKTSTSDLVATLNALVHHPEIQFCIRLFTSICVVTSFLGVSISLVDFLADGLRMEKRGFSNIFLHLLAFLPPLVIAILYPDIFILALEYGGVYCLVLLVLLPALMAWRGRYVYHFKGPFEVIGGKTLLLLLIIVSSVLILRHLISY